MAKSQTCCNIPWIVKHEVIYNDNSSSSEEINLLMETGDDLLLENNNVISIE